MKKVLLCLVVVLCVGVSQAAVINWGTSAKAYEAGNETGWVSQLGTSVIAINASDSANATVYYGGIDWANTDALEALAGVTQNNVTITAGAANLSYANAFGPGLFTDPENFYNGGLYNLGSLDISGLTPGQRYELQMMVIDDRGTDVRNTILGDGTQDWLASVNAGTAGAALIRTDPKGAGSSIIGNFVADLTGTQAISIYGNASSDLLLRHRASTAQFNALQLRDGSEPVPETHFVDADAPGDNDGSSWQNAFHHLQDAIAAASFGDSIWVAEGVYKPDQGVYQIPGDRNASFQLKNNVQIKGGFVGYGASDPNENDPELYPVVLSGDLNGDDGPDFTNNGENSYHVVTGSGTNATAVQDGFTITAGNANGSWPNERAGGMFNDDGSPTITNCTFSGNSAIWRGGGMHNAESSLTLTNCTFSGNSAPGGGGILNIKSSPKVTNCTFSGNSGGGAGGGMQNWDNSSPTLTNCTFSWNSGGGMFNGEYSNPTLDNCTFIDNSAQGGGGMQNVQSSPTLTNCTFTGNSADGSGGGMSNWDNCSPTVTNCTFSGNSAQWGGGMANGEYSNQTVTNCILWGNSWPQINEDWTSSTMVSYSDVQGGWPGTGNINANPLFLNTSNDDLHLLPTSPCIDAGDNTGVPAGVTTDLDGNPRFVDQPEVPDTGNGTAPIVDMGVYEANYVEVAMKFTPKVLNLHSKGKWIKAHLVLPEGFDVNDVDANTPAVIAPLGIESEYMNVFINGDGLVEIEAAFKRADFCGLVTSDDDTEVMVIGLLTSGQQFYGTDTIRITNNHIEYLAVLSSHWLQTDCGPPDWCNEADLNADSVVNFVDFAMLDGCCIEVVTD